MKRVLAIETSCDDTSVALVTEGGWVDAVVSANQDLAHRPFGGVVPEIASRNHTLSLLPLIDEAFAKANLDWDDVDGIAVTSRPGLVGALLVGVITAKTLAIAKGKALIGVNHLEAHLQAPFLSDEKYKPLKLDYPLLGLVVSGGHSHLYNMKAFGDYEIIGRTLDDAAGEAFDKFAKLLGLGFPGGVRVDKLAKEGDPKAFQFPRGLAHEDRLDYSFSGVKAAGLRFIEEKGEEFCAENLNDICASYQEAIVDALMNKLDLAVKKFGYTRVAIGGGVSANSRLRAVSEEWAKKNNIDLVIPPLRYCTDNAAMVGWAGLQRLQRGEVSGQELGPSAQSHTKDFSYVKA